MPFPDQFSILITQELVDGELLYVGSVDELPNIGCFEDSYREAWEILVDAICTLRQMNEEAGGISENNAI